MSSLTNSWLNHISRLRPSQVHRALLPMRQKNDRHMLAAIALLSLVFAVEVVGELPCQGGDEEIVVTFYCSTKCVETSWQVQDTGGILWAEGQNFTDYSNITSQLCLPPRTYNLVLFDSAGNGWDAGTALSLQGSLQPQLVKVQFPLSSKSYKMLVPFSVVSPQPSSEAMAPGAEAPGSNASDLSTPGCGNCAQGLRLSPGTPCSCAFPMVVVLQLPVDGNKLSGNMTFQAQFINQTALQLALSPLQVRVTNIRPGLKMVSITLELLPMTAPVMSASEVQSIVDKLYGNNGQKTLHFSPALGVPSYMVSNITYPPGTGPGMAKGSSGVNRGMILGVIASVAGVLVLFAALLWFWRSRDPVDSFPTSQSKNNHGSDRSTNYNDSERRRRAGRALEDKHKPQSEVYTYKELHLATNGFAKVNVIGEGGFGRVYRAIMPTGAVAAVKQLDPTGRQGDREFRVEVALLSRLHHPHLVELIGYCADSEHRLLAYEFMPNGSLQDHLYGKQIGKGVPLDWATRMRVAVGSARGLQYLHDVAEPRVIHRDFKSSNILLNHDFVAKVADFGLAKLAPDQREEQISTRVLGTFGYVAPEYVMSGHLTEKSDVYSFGVVLLELITGRRPVDVSQPHGQQSLVAWCMRSWITMQAGPYLSNKEKLVRMVDPLLYGQYPLKSLYHIAAVAAMCVQSEPDYRPLMADVVESLVPLLQMNAHEVRLEMPPIKVKEPEQHLEQVWVQQQKDGSQVNCLMCATGPRDMMLQPCWHVVCCLPCAARLAGSHLPCPVCRRLVYGAQKAPRSTPGEPSSGSGYLQDASHLEM